MEQVQLRRQGIGSIPVDFSGVYTTLRAELLLRSPIVSELLSSPDAFEGESLYAPRELVVAWLSLLSQGRLWGSREPEDLHICLQVRTNARRLHVWLP
jgi:hypothetical protein